MIWWMSLAAAYELNGVDWSWQDTPIEDPFAVNLDDFPASFADPVALEAVWKQAVRTWSVEGGALLYLQDAGTTTVTRWGYGDDGVNATTYGGRDPGFGLATATWAVDGPDIIDCDIEIYANNIDGPIPWHIDATSLAGPNDYDMLATLTHEMGHCLGLGHSRAAQSVMYAYIDTGTPEAKRHLTFDDQEGLLAMYGPAAADLVVADVVLPTALGPGEVGTIEVTVNNLGPGWAVDVLGLITVGEGPLLAPIPGAEMGDVAPNSAVGSLSSSLSFTVEVPDDCDVDADVPVTFELSTVLGPGPLATAEVPVRCAVTTPTTDTAPTAIDTGTPPGTPTDPPTDTPAGSSTRPADNDDNGGCGCRTGLGATGLWIVLLVPWVRRR